MKGQCSANFEVQSLVFPTLTLSLRGFCELTHLGLTTWTGTQTVNLLTGAFVNEADYTAANGDTLHGTTTGVSEGNPIVVFAGTETYTSGTGRFESVSGQAEINGGASFITGTGYWTTSGTVAYGG